MRSEPATSNPGMVLPTSLPIPDGHVEVLPPWTVGAEAWWIIPSVPMPWQTKKLPKGAIDPFEAERYQELQATYTGGLGTIQLIRYHTSPIGPYDELMYIPGNMTYKTGANSTISGLSITRIYVSTTASIVNGNAPKQLARFEFTKEDESDPLSPVLASVYPALPNSISEFSPDPVFSTRLVPSRRIPKFSLDLGLFPEFLFDFRVFQAPLTDFGQAHNGFVGTEKWCSTAPTFSGDVRVMYPEPRLNDGKVGDGEGFPDVRPMSVGLWWPAPKVFFTAPVVLDLFGQPVVEEDKKTK